MAVTKAAILSGILGGGLVLGTLVTYDGSATLNAAKERIAQQASALNVFESQQNQMGGKIQELKAKIADLETNGTEEDQATIDALNAELTSIETNADASSEQIADRINALEAEVQKANTEAAELQETLDTTATTAAPLTQREMDEMMDAIPEGYTIFGMFSDTPQIIPGTSDKLVVDKAVTETDSNLIISNYGSLNYSVRIAGGESQLVPVGGTLQLGDVTALDGQTMVVYDAYGKELTKLYLSAE